MISFIIIGKNEGQYLERCFLSVRKYIDNNQINNPQMIYVDSNSEDESIEIAKKFRIDKIILLRGDISAAVARNEGAKCADEEILFFIDGDMEIDDKSYQFCFKNFGLINPFISGHVVDRDENGKETFRKENIKIFCGGVFLIQKSLWNNIGGMDTIFNAYEDYDLCLRLYSSDIKLKRLDRIIAVHNTNKVKKLINFNEIYRSVLVRRNFFNRYSIWYLLRNNYSALLLFFALLSLNRVIFIVYIASLFVLSILNKKPGYCFIRFAIDSLNLIGFFFFYPKEKKQYSIEILK